MTRRIIIRDASSSSRTSNTLVTIYKAVWVKSVVKWNSWVMAEIFHKWESISSSLSHPASICIIADIFNWIHFTQYQEVDHTLVVETWETWLLMTALASSLKVWKLSIFGMFIFTFIKLTICLVSDIAGVCWWRENSEYEVITRIGGNKTETH